MSTKYRHSAAVISSLLLASSLGFGAWVQMTSGTAADLYAVHFPEGTQVGYVVGASPEGGGVVFKTTDGGTTWILQDPATMNSLYSVYFKDNNTGFAVGAAGTAIRTTDGGGNWTPMPVPVTDQLNRVQFPENGQVGYIGVYPRGGSAIALKTVNGGDNWSGVTVGGQLDTSRSCGFATDLIGVVVGSKGLVVGTIYGLDSGNGYQGSRTTANLTAAAFSRDDPNKGYVIGSDTIQGIVRYTATGGTPLWDSVRCPVVTSFYGVDMPTSDAAYICGTGGFIGRSVLPTDFCATTVPNGLTATMWGLCFPHGADTGYAVGSSGTILKTTDAGIPWWPGVAEGKAPATARAGIRVATNPSRHGITLRSDVDVNVVVYDAAGRAIASRTATRGPDFLPLSTGAYFVVATAEGFSTTQKVVVER